MHGIGTRDMTTASRTSSIMQPCSRRLIEGGLARFATKCRHNAMTGCVEWEGGTTTARGHTARYGAFWFNGSRWLAHRWAAKYIHGLEICERVVTQLCSDPLCQQHLISTAIESESALRYRWVRVQVGLDDLPEQDDAGDDDVPFYLTPEWLLPFSKKEINCDVPF